MLKKLPAMPTHKIHLSQSEFYFCTITCYKWIRLFEITNLYDHIYKWLDILNSKGCYSSAYVIMPNHMHLLLFPRNNAPVLNKLIANGKRFMAYEIIKRLKSTKNHKILQILNGSVTCFERKYNQRKHRVFTPSFHAIICENEKIIEQKIDYIHSNPLSGKWKLCALAPDFIHSSCSYYETGNSKAYKNLTDYRIILNGEVEL